MPRRPVKNPRLSRFQPGQSGNPAGRPPGSPNKIVISDQVREAFAQLLEGAVPHLQDWLERTAQRSPEKALDLWVRISERFVPSLQRVDHNIEGGQMMIPIQINLPQMPSVGAPTQIPLNTSPAEEIKEIPGDIPELSAPAEAPPLAFKIPSLMLTPNQLRDLREMGEVPPGDETGPAEGDMGELTK